MSGLLPTLTGVRDNVSPSPIPDVPLLAEVLGQAGFETAAFVSAVVVSGPRGSIVASITTPANSTPAWRARVS